MLTSADWEILGDWNNLKGTAYHLAYALWLILRDQAREVGFFAGNDLLAAPAPPPPMQVNPQGGGIIPLSASSGDGDIWIQLKFTDKPWTIGEILGENLLFNFICNSYHSEALGRHWRVQLVTEGPVRAEEIRAFAAGPAKKPVPHRTFEAILVKAMASLQADRGRPIPAAELKRRALDILLALAETVPTPLGTLKAEIELELAYACPDRREARRLASALVGAMLDDAARGPSNARRYDSAWVEEVTGRVIKSSRPFDTDVVLACDLAAVRAASGTPIDPFESDQYAERPALRDALEQFLQAPEPLFVLLGESGVVKSWALVSWTMDSMRGRVRILASGRDLDASVTLDRIAADAMSRYTSRDSSDEQIFGLLEAAAGPGRGPFVIVVDDLQVLDREPDRLRALVVRMARRAAEGRVKLVISCQKATWELNDLGAEIQAGQLYDPARHISETRTTYSFLLGGYDAGELEDAVGRGAPGLSPPRERELRLRLLGPEFLPIRNPFLLARYLEQVGPGSTPPRGSEMVEDLLSHFVWSQLEKAARGEGWDPSDLRDAYHALIGRLWDVRPAGLRYPQAVQLLSGSLPDQGSDAMRELRSVGLVASRGPIQIPEGIVADFLFAGHLQRQVEAGETSFDDLDPRRDASVVQALIRQVADFVPLVDLLSSRGERWRPVIASGISQCHPDDRRVVAIAACLTRPASQYVADPDGCRSLGTLASRGRWARRLAVEMYLSGDQSESYRGANSLSFSTDFIPRTIARIVRRRWRAELRWGGGRDRETLARRLAHAIGPFERLSRREAAHEARVLLDELGRGSDFSALPKAGKLLDELDEIRGQTLRFQGDGDIRGLFEEIRTGGRQSRLRAATAIRPIAMMSPERASAMLCELIREERDAHVLLRLLWGCVRVVEHAPIEILEAFALSIVARWDDPTAAGPALTLLGYAAPHAPRLVIEHLPRRLDRMPPWARACLGDVLAFAWWRCAESVPEARGTLEALSEPEFDGVTRHFSLFARRGAAIARMGLCFLGRAPASELSVSMTRHDGESMPYVFTETNRLFANPTTVLESVPGLTAVAELLLSALNGVHEKPGLRMREGLANAFFHCVRHCLDDLARIAAVQADPSSWLRRLPRDWKQLHATRRVLELGRSDPGLVDFAEAACEEHAGGFSTLVDERQRLLARIGAARGTPEKAVEEQIAELRGSVFGMANQEQARAASDLIDAHPERLLDLLESCTGDPDNIPFLESWRKQCRTWRAFLASRVFARMLRPDPIGRREAGWLVGSMLDVVGSLMESSLRREYEVVYRTIRIWLGGGQSPVSLPKRTTSPIRLSHDVARELLERASRAVATRETPDWIDGFLSDRRCWWETRRYKLEEDTLTVGAGGSIYMIYAFPALRLAAWAVGARYGIVDPASRFMLRRLEANQLLREVHSLTESWAPPEHLEDAVTRLRSAPAEIAGNEWLLHSQGNTLLRLGQLAEATVQLQRCVESPMGNDEVRSMAHYDLACVAARLGRSAECRVELEESIQLSPCHHHHMASDPDFESVRAEPWFVDLLPVAAPPGDPPYSA